MQEHYYKLKPILLISAFTIVLLIGWVRFLTGPEFALSFLYLLPIVMVTWLFGKTWGVLVSFASALSWLVADLFMIERFSNSYIPIINELVRFAVFICIVFMIVKYKRTLEALKELAMMDPLTGIANRRAFLQLAQIEINRSRRYNHPFSIMVIDIDNFKQVNDRFGHQMGDRLLIAVVETIKQHVRDIDIVARFGGDEFVLLLVRTDEKSATRVAHKLRKQLLEIMENNKWRVTFSIGLATYLSPPDNIFETIKVADDLMYCVKQEGKNNIKHAVINPNMHIYEKKS